MKVFITTYALTSGIQEVDDAKRSSANDGVMWAHGSYGCLQFAHKPNWHETMHEATTRAEAMRVAKIASLRKSIAKLEKLTFVVSA